jgi:galactose-1-phosphate uridylyltransferase
MKIDIINRIKSDFEKDSNKALEILKNKLKELEYLNNDRIIRCIIYLSKGSIKELNNYIDLAKQDPRDVMMYAEYKEGSNFENFKRLRDFNKTFENCEKNVKE